MTVINKGNKYINVIFVSLLCVHIYTLVYFECLHSFLATARLVSNEIQKGNDLILPTELTFESNGSCGLQPIVSAARLQFTPFNGSGTKTLVLCDPMCNTTLQEMNGVTYDFANFGNITIRNSNASAGIYMLGMQRPCPTPSSVITATYTVSFSSTGKLPVHMHVHMYVQSL